MGVPYGWWKYHNSQMLGILIKGWSDLPIEAVLLWIAAGFGTVLFYEALRMYFYMGKPWKRALLDRRNKEDFCNQFSQPVFSSLPDYCDNGIGLPVPVVPLKIRWRRWQTSTWMSTSITFTT